MSAVAADPHHIFPDRNCYPASKKRVKKFKKDRDDLAWRYHNLEPFVIMVLRRDHDWIEDNIVPPPFPSPEQQKRAIATYRAFRRGPHNKIYSLEEAVDYMVSLGATKRTSVPKRGMEFPSFLRAQEGSRPISEALGSRFRTTWE